jgi:hypothetical protein
MFQYLRIVFVGRDDRSQCVSVNAGSENIDWNSLIEWATRIGVDN